MDNNMDFLPRHKLSKTTQSQFDNIKLVDPNYDYLSEQVKKLNLDQIDFENTEYDSVETKVDKQKVYFWIRVYLSEEVSEIEPGDDINIKYMPSGEELTTKFICYSKKGGSSIEYKDGEPVVANYNSEDDTKCLCLMVDEEKINYDSEDIPLIKKLFKIGRHFEYVFLKRSDLVLTINRLETKLNYYDIEF
jgi:hypothetical protein